MAVGWSIKKFPLVERTWQFSTIFSAALYVNRGDSDPPPHRIPTGRFIMYSGITKLYERKTVGHVFRKPVQIEGTTQTLFPSKLFFIVVHISAARRCECM